MGKGENDGKGNLGDNSEDSVQPVESKSTRTHSSVGNSLVPNVHIASQTPNRLPAKKTGSIRRIFNNVTNVCKKVITKVKKSSKETNTNIPPWAELYEDKGMNYISFS